MKYFLTIICISPQIENVVIEVPFPKTVLNVTLSANQGKNSFDPVSKLMTWDVGKIDPAKLPSIKGSVSGMSSFLYQINAFV